MALHLAAKGDRRALVTLVEKWSQVGDPTPAARLAEARALVDLRQLDRAWVRLKDLVDIEPPDPDALVVAAEMFVLRGWPNKARKAVQRGLAVAPEHAALAALRERVHEGPTEPDEEAEAVESEQTSVADLVRVAEHHLAHGAFVRARTLLERARRKAPDHRWVGDLLWALDGELAGGASTLADLCAELGPEPVLIAEPSDEPEHTESARLADLRMPVEREDDARFSSLFRNLGGAKAEASTRAPRRDESAEPEVTEVRSLASVSTLGRDGRVGTADPEGDDTQIVRVINRGDGGLRPGDTAVDAILNLAASDPSGRSSAAHERREGTGAEGSDYATGPEEEDDSVVVHTRRDEPDEERDRTPDVSQGVLDDAATEQAAKERRGAVEDAGWAQPGASAPSTQPRQRPTPVPADRARKPQGSQPSPRPAARTVAPSLAWPWWVAVLAAGLAFGVLVFGLIALVAALR